MISNDDLNAVRCYGTLSEPWKANPYIGVQLAQELWIAREALRVIAGGHIPPNFSLEPDGFHERICTWSQQIAKAALASASETKGDEHG